MSAIADCWIATPPAWILPLLLPSPSRCTAVAPYVWHRLVPVCLWLVLPICMYEWQTQSGFLEAPLDRCGEGEGGGKLYERSQNVKNKSFIFTMNTFL